jgi:hypothetical protein
VGKVAGEQGLVEHGTHPAHEAVLAGVMANVIELAVGLDIRVHSGLIGLALASETGNREDNSGGFGRCAAFDDTISTGGFLFLLLLAGWLLVGAFTFGRGWSIFLLLLVLAASLHTLSSRPRLAIHEGAKH